MIHPENLEKTRDTYNYYSFNSGGIPLHIGIDLDNTILDATSSHLHYYNKVSGLSLTPNDVNDFYLYRMYGWNNEERDEIYLTYGHDIHWNSSPYQMAKENLEILYAKDKITIITARPVVFQEVTIKWLEYHGISYHDIKFTENKLLECQRMNIDILIDDGPHYAEEFALANKYVILYEQPYNRHIRKKNVYHASNWIEVINHIERLKIEIFDLDPDSND